jgi:hypothetical protein
MRSGQKNALGAGQTKEWDQEGKQKDEQPERLTKNAPYKAEYMTAPERFADSQIPLAPRAPSIHDPEQA